MSTPTIHRRSTWEAKEPTKDLNTIPLAERTHLVVHYYGPEVNFQIPVPALLRSIQKYHQSKGWSDIGYNFAVDQDGECWEARGRDKVGAHSPGWNRTGIGVIVLVGGDQKPSDKALITLRALRARLEQEKGGDLIEAVHSDNTDTACPGKHLTYYIRAGMPEPGSVKPAPAKATARPGPLTQPPHPMDEDHSSCDHASHPPSAPPVLRRGDYNMWVSILQRYLRIGEDGDFGPNTERAVVAAQRGHGIAQDGIVGPQTWKALGLGPVA